ncbi:hypothetical protein COCC4DRAFT_208038 [Bipolaris maydis ATCC 48331]|uniref:Large ribosomal subunit protein mL50 n=2 Tax=Cochliobolus heterostrophus TaxID=5016 RepID=M2TUJ6_COCH5|nr:uncharacterized protein COCC4DRAFT_208038 [Bipolaris maydis ATCC 48331]EMD85416.1 hypothetical protein COCHEDRAFT_1188136 [Bipolaris maydis C5]ENH99424.1 hypothetical protein COCC4DRAFT_208038 [Bipolaris maydis ATCC 48331]KAH7548805.1 hypothetical protein BM1_10830 [Bipolaris maydis]KAJ6212323.1 hypothetical protein PSV09DRAFT_1188136 [Bipolaris maydis]
MRRIPRPSRATDPSHSLSASICQRVSPLPYRGAASPCAHIRAAAAFSTTSPNRFLLPGKQDKKKHQQFVRRWQKRLLGDSEPIGAHVDPYDPTSPVRIAPEEQGEYVEVLDDEGPNFPHYKPSENISGLQRVGGEEWLKQKVEKDMAVEFEKLTLRTYTPLTLEMADEIEELTGTPYTLKDENLMMAQTVHEKTKRPYTTYNFGLHTKVTRPSDLRNRFTQAIAEIYAMKQAGLEMDFSKFANRGIYDAPRWVKDIKLVKTDGGDLALAFPQHKNLEQLLESMQSAPTWEPALEESDELLVEEAEDIVATEEQPPIMDPDTPTHKRAAVVKMDDEKKPFDFMSNRPVPRSKPVEKPVVEEITPKATSTSLPPEPPTQKSETQSAKESRSRTQHSILEGKAQRLAEDFAALRRAVQQARTSGSAAKPEETKWRQIQVADVDLKFALYKRLYQLTGYRISDPDLTSANTLGDLYNSLCLAAKPQPTSLFSAIHVEGQKAREKAKREAESAAEKKRKADLGDLINLGNVELRRVKATKPEKRSKIGLDKVVHYALWERGLGTGMPLRSVKKGKRKARAVVGLSRKRAEFSKPLSSKGADFLAKKTRMWREGREEMAQSSAV